MIRAPKVHDVAKDRSGSALIEFALVAPVITILLLGMYDLGTAFMARFKLASATQSVADLATQSAQVQAADITNFFAAGADVMAPFSSSTLIFRISNIATDGAGRVFVYWSCGQGTLTPLAPKTTISDASLTRLLTTNKSQSGNYTIDGTNTSFILVESQYGFTPAAGFVIRGLQTLTGTAYAMPRVSTYIGPTTGDPNYTPTAPTAIANTFNANISGNNCSFGY